MKASTVSMKNPAIRRASALALAAASFSLLSMQSRADDFDKITVSAPSVTIVGRNTTTNANIEKVRVTARLHVDPLTLTTSSGVALLRHAVYDAAKRACAATDPREPTDPSCIRLAVATAQSQVDAFIARAK